MNKLSIRARNEAEQLRFEAKIKGEQPKLKIRYGFSEVDIFTNERFYWDYHITLPFKLKKGSIKDKTLREGINNLWKTVINL